MATEAQPPQSQGFRQACLQYVLSMGYKDRLFAVEMCGEKAGEASKEECEVALDKRTPSFLKETWPGIGALVLGMEDEFPCVRQASVRAIGRIASAHPALKDMCVKVALEGLQDSDLGVRLASLRVALESDPKPLRTREIRLLLETIANDKSEEVKSQAMAFFLQGPVFFDNALALASVEWLANISPHMCSLRYMYNFGLKHADVLYFCGAELEASYAAANTSSSSSHHHHHHRPNKLALVAALAGVCQRWGLPVQLTNAALKQDCLEAMQRFASSPSSSSSPPSAMAGEFWQQFASYKNSASTSDKQRFLRQWSGFDARTSKRLKKWAKDASTTENEEDDPLEIGFENDNVDDEDAPYQARFQVVANRAGGGGANGGGLQIARYSVLVRAMHYHQSDDDDDVKPRLAYVVASSSSQPADGRREITLTVKERRGPLTVFEPVNLALASVVVGAGGGGGGASATPPQFWVEN